MNNNHNIIAPTIICYVSLPGDAIPKYMGNAIPSDASSDATCPFPCPYKLASPHHLLPIAAPLLVAVGTADKDVPPDLVTEFYDRAAAAAAATAEAAAAAAVTATTTTATCPTTTAAAAASAATKAHPGNTHPVNTSRHIIHAAAVPRAAYLFFITLTNPN